MLVSLPESFAAYATQKDVRTAVDHILCRKSLEVPSDLDWDQLPDYHAAVLAAYQVRSDYASTLHNLWNQAWRPALFSSDLNFQALSIVEAHEKYGEAYTDTNSVWDSKEFWRYFRINNLLVMPGISLGICKVQLWLWLGDESSESNNTEQLLEPLRDWYLEIEEESEVLFGYTRKELAPVTDAGIEVCRLCAAATQAGGKID